MKPSFSEIIQGNTPVLVDFYAEWCVPCKMMPPILQEVKTQLGDKIKIIKIDTDRNQEVSMAYQIQSIPTMILFKEGKILWRNSGVLPATELVRKINSFL